MGGMQSSSSGDCLDDVMTMARVCCNEEWVLSAGSGSGRRSETQRMRDSWKSNDKVSCGRSGTVHLFDDSVSHLACCTYKLMAVDGSCLRVESLDARMETSRGGDTSSEHLQT